MISYSLVIYIASSKSNYVRYGHFNKPLWADVWHIISRTFQGNNLIDSISVVFRYHCINTALSMINAWVQFVDHELGLKEGTIGIKIVVQGNKRINSDSPCISMGIPNLIWLKKFFVFEKLASTSNVCMDALNRVHIHVFYTSTFGWLTAVKKRAGQKWIKNATFELWEAVLAIKQQALFIPMLLLYQI